MTSATDELIADGLRAWTAGNLDALQAVLPPEVTLRWVEPGDWDCTGRDQVMRLLRWRQAAGNRPHPVSVQRCQRTHLHRLLDRTRRPRRTPAVPRRDPCHVAGGKVIAMQQYRTDGPGEATT
jgi:hypothetical protein